MSYLDYDEDLGLYVDDEGGAYYDPEGSEPCNNDGDYDTSTAGGEF